MGDASAKKTTSIPDWQKNYIQSSDTPADETSNASAVTTSNTDLLEKAKLWLEDDLIRDATRTRKEAFLEQKGLQGEDIQKLLGADSPPQEAGMKIVYDSAVSTSTPAAPTQSTASPLPTTSSTTASTKPPIRDIPPIITYPEFLMRPEKPPPLVTFQRLAYAAYGFAGLATLTYGASKYLMQPMLDSLTSARHEFAETTIQNLEKLNSKLENNVSHVPYMTSSALLKHKEGEDGYDDDDVETIDSDPTELFHRDIATQTSPKQSRTASMSTSTSMSLHRDANPTASQEKRISTIHSSLASILGDTSSATANTESLKSTVEDLQGYLDRLNYSSNTFQTNYDHILPGIEAQKNISKAKDPDDAADKFKAEIRAVKGALLSSRNFPTGGRQNTGGQGVYSMIAGR